MCNDSPAPIERSITLLDAAGRSIRSPVKGAWGGHRGSKIYGRLDCRSALRAIARGGYVRSRVFFADEQTAVAAGYRPCAVCCPSEYRAWKETGASADATHAARPRPNRRDTPVRSGPRHQGA